MRRIYLDHAATTPVRPEVLDAMLPYYAQTFGNASSLHTFGQEAKRALEESRATVARCLGADPEEIYFTSGGTESDNLAIKGVAHACQKRGRHIITSQVEHHAVLNSCACLEKEGFEVTCLPVDRYGVVDPADLKAAIRADTVLVSIMLANNETGTLQPLSDLARTATERGVLVHTDAVQAVGKVPVRVGELGVDLLSISGHKLYGPKGIGALYVRKGVRMDPLFHGGHHEQEKRPGTENVPSIVGLAKAIELATDEMDSVMGRIAGLRNHLEDEVRAKIDAAHVNGHPEARLPNVLNMSFEHAEGESLLLRLDRCGIAVATGSACTSGTLEPSHVLKAMGLPRQMAQGSIRFSLGRDNTQEDIDYVVESSIDVVERLRRMSPLYEESKEKGCQCSGGVCRPEAHVGRK